MWLKINFPFKITGKLSTTPEQAKEMFGYDMKHGALGIVLRRQNDRTIIRSLMPKDVITKSTWRKNQDKKFKAINGIVRDYNNLLIRPVWGKDIRGYSAPCRRFISVNMRGLGNPPDWLNIRLTVGNLPVPKIYSKGKGRKHYSPIIEEGKIKFSVKNANNKEIGIGIFDRKQLKLYLIAPKRYINTDNIEIPIYRLGLRVKSPIIYVFFKQDDEYSKSKVLLATHG